MTTTEETVQSIELVQCPTCFGARIVQVLVWPRKCEHCSGWGCVIDPPSFEERLSLGLRALHPANVIALATIKRKRLRLPLRKKRKT